MHCVVWFVVCLCVCVQLEYPGMRQYVDAMVQEVRTLCLLAPFFVCMLPVSSEHFLAAQTV